MNIKKNSKIINNIGKKYDTIIIYLIEKWRKLCYNKILLKYIKFVEKRLSVKSHLRNGE